MADNWQPLRDRLALTVVAEARPPQARAWGFGHSPLHGCLPLQPNLGGLPTNCPQFRIHDFVSGHDV